MDSNIVDHDFVSTMPLVEIHSHILDDAGLALIREERLSYVLTMGHGDSALRFARENSDICGALAWVNPLDDQWLAEARKLAGEYADVIKGFKIHPAGGKYPVNYDLLAGLFELANELGLMIQSHTAALPAEEPGQCSAGLFEPLMKAFPDTTFLAIHGTPGPEAWDLVNAYPNVYIDTSYTAWGKEYQQKALAAVGKEKILMGLDSPLGFPKNDGVIQPHFRDAAEEIAAFYDNDRDVVEHVMWRNAARVLRLQIAD